MSISDVFDGLVQKIASILPTSPFKGVIDQLNTGGLPALGWLNWFFPVSECLTVLGLWLAAIALYYLYMVVARWVKLIGD